MYIDQRDSAHNASFAAIGGKPEYMQIIYDECIGYCIFPIKNPTYKWSNSEDWRKKVYNITNIDFYCSANPDQMEPYVQWLCISKQTKRIFQYLFGFIIRLGFFGNNLEHILLKPVTLAIIANYFKLYPLKWLYEFTYGLGNIITLKRSLEDETTNKIRLYLYYTYCASSLYKRFLRLFSKDIDKLFQSAMYIYWTNGSKEWMYKLFYKE